VPGEGPLGAGRGRRRGAARVYPALKSVHQHDAGRTPGAVQCHGVRSRRKGRHSSNERWRRAGLVERADQWPRRGRAR